MAPPTYARANGLSQQQLNAAEYILVGFNDTDTAERIGVTRETVTRWRLYDDGFRTHLDRRRRDVWAGAVDALRAALPRAAQTIYGELAVGKQRGRLALELLTRAGLLGKPYSGALGLLETDPPTTPPGAPDEASDDEESPEESPSVTEDHTAR